MVDEVLHMFLENNKVDGWWSTTHGLENGLEKSITEEYEWMVDEVLYTFLENNKVDGWWSTCVKDFGILIST